MKQKHSWEITDEFCTIAGSMSVNVKGDRHRAGKETNGAF
jgi:hypothetical protein